MSLYFPAPVAATTEHSLGETTYVSDVGDRTTDATWEGAKTTAVAPGESQPTVEQILAGYRQIIRRGHARGLKVFGGTLPPFEGMAFPGFSATPAGEAKREAINRWIRSSGIYDGVIDFDRAVRDPSHPSRLLPAFDSGDHGHPNDAGYEAMASVIDPSLFQASSAPAVPPERFVADAAHPPAVDP